MLKTAYDLESTFKIVGMVSKNWKGKKKSSENFKKNQNRGYQKNCV